MERKIVFELLNWKNSTDRLPLVLHGARQVGKTFTVSEFGKQYYPHFVYFNFEANDRLKQLFENDLSPNRIIKELSILSNEPIIEHSTLIFFDEIQACERALTSLKYFAEETPNYHIIVAGSLLGVAINREKYSFPVGKVTIKTMFPMDFEEFLWAMGKKEASEIINDSYSNNAPCSIHDYLLDLYRLYLCIGGMPKVLHNYLENNDFDKVDIIQRDIIDSYIADMVKYTSQSESIKLIMAYNSIPAQLAKENKKFQFKLIKSGARANQYETALEWLCASGVTNKCTKVTQGKFPLSLFAEHSFFKLYLSDVGLLRNRYGISPNIILAQQENMEHIKGTLAENYVSNALKTNKLHNFYWESEGKAELDFVIQTPQGTCIPIEVKSSNNVKAKSLKEFVNKYNPPYSIRVSTKNFGFENNIKSVPLYACWCIK